MTPRPRPSTPHADAGHTLLEATVALALLTTALLPLSAGLYFATASGRSTDQVAALAYAQEALETALHDGAPVSLQWWIDAEGQVLAELPEEEAPPPRWRVVREVTHDGARVYFAVRVYRGHRPAPLVTLQTLRLR